MSFYHTKDPYMISMNTSKNTFESANQEPKLSGRDLTSLK